MYNEYTRGMGTMANAFTGSTHANMKGIAIGAAIMISMGEWGINEKLTE